MAMNFPVDPQDGDTYDSYIYDGAIGAWIGGQNNYATIYYVDIGLAEKIDSDERGVPNGVATLESNGHITSAQLAGLVDGAPQNLDTLGKIATQFVLKTTTQWASHTGFLAEASINVEVITETGQVRVKIGDGSKTWAQADYVVMESDMTTYVAAELLDFLDTVTDITDTKANTSDVNTALASKLDATAAQTTYAPIDSPSFTTAATLPTNTSIGDVSSTEIGYVNGVTSGIQGQLDDKAPLESPTFTGTVSGVTKSMVGLGDVDNTSDADKPVSTAAQTALDLKANLSGATFTGSVTLSGDPTQALHASTKAYVDNVSSGLLAKPSVIAATTANIVATYNNGTDGVGATLTANSNGAFPQIDGVSVTTTSGQRGVLVKNQTNSYENGRYNLTVQGDAGTAWVLTRCGLCDQANEIPGAYIFVTDGSINGQTGWVQNVDNPATFVVGTDDIDVFQFAGAGAITAGTNIEVSGNEVSVIASPVFSDVVDASAAGIEFSDGVQTKAGVPSQTSFIYKTASYTLDALTLADNIIEVDSTSATTVTIPLDSSVNYPVGTSIDILQTNTGQVTVAATGGVTMNGTPGFKLRTRWSSATILKRAANTWIVFGDLMA